MYDLTTLPFNISDPNEVIKAALLAAQLEGQSKAFRRHCLSWSL